VQPVEDALAEARRRFRNWGRWGHDDVLGTLNFIDDAKRARAASLARRGRAISLAMEFNRDGPRRGDRGRGNPIHTMLESGIEAAASDTCGFEVRPGEFDEPSSLPLHQIAIPNMGLFLGEMFDLEELSADCAADGVYEFLLIAAGLPITGGVGAPVNPIAIK
jgi:hypothetical protein